MAAAVNNMSEPPTTSLGRQLCGMWGLDANRVAHITIDIDSVSLPTVTVTMWTDDYTATVINQHRLVPIDRPGDP